MKRARLAIFVLALGAVACSLFVNTEALTGARASAADAADYDADAALDASASDDAVTGLDATSDAVPDGASGLRFCESPLYSALFCADFDGTDPFEKFSVKEEDNGTLMVTSSADGGAAGLSPPNALRAVVFPADGGAESSALLSHVLQSADQDLSLSLSARFGPVVEALALAMYLGSNQIAVLVKPEGFIFLQLTPDGGVLSQADVLQSLSPNWVHLRFDVRVKGPQPSLTFYVDGVKKLDRRAIVGEPAGLGALGFSIGALLGAQMATPAPATIDYDNVLFDVKPLP